MNSSTPFDRTGQSPSMHQIRAQRWQARARVNGRVLKPTERQLRVLRLIFDSIRERGYAPTLRDIGAHMSIRSTNGVNDHIRALERKGLVERDDGTARGIRLTQQGLAVLGEVGGPLLDTPDPNAVALGHARMARELLVGLDLKSCARRDRQHHSRAGRQ